MPPGVAVNVAAAANRQNREHVWSVATAIVATCAARTEIMGSRGGVATYAREKSPTAEGVQEMMDSLSSWE